MGDKQAKDAKKAADKADKDKKKAEQDAKKKADKAEKEKKKAANKENKLKENALQARTKDNPGLMKKLDGLSIGFSISFDVGFAGAGYSQFANFDCNPQSSFA